MDGRRELRSPQKLQVLLSNDDRPVGDAYALTENVSANGARVRADRQWSPGAYVQFKSALGELWAHGRVIYCQKLPAHTFAVGLQFLVRTGAWMMRS